MKPIGTLPLAKSLAMELVYTPNGDRVEGAQPSLVKTYDPGASSR